MACPLKVSFFLAQKSGTCPDKHRSLLDIPRRYQLIILFFVIVLIITFYFALLGMVIENNKLEEFNFKMLQQIVERFERSNQSQLRNM